MPHDRRAAVIQRLADALLDQADLLQRFDEDLPAFGQTEARAALKEPRAVFLLQAADVAADALIGNALLLRCLSPS